MSAEKYQNKYKIDSTRMQHFSYASKAAYFVTIVTHNREHFFGEIQNGKMILNQMGEIAKNEWLKSPEIRPDMNLYMKDFIVMPNHIHGIVYIGANEYNSNICFKNHINKFGPQRKNLSSIIRGYKSSVTVNARKTYPEFCWQARFHERIIRNHHEFRRIKNYILDNPMKWQIENNQCGLWL